MNERLYQSQKNKINNQFQTLLTDARELLGDISKGRRIELQANGVTYRMVDPSDETELCDVLYIEDGVITLENGYDVNVSEFTNLTDLHGLIERIEF